MSARFQILTAAVLFGTTGTAQALGPGGSPLVVGAARIAVGALLLALVAARVSDGGRALLRRPEIALAGVFVAIYQLTFFEAVAETGVAVGTVVALGSAPAFAGAFSRVVNGESPSRRWAGATALAASGVALMALAGGGATEVEPAGILLALCSGAGYAGYTVLAKRLLDAGHAPERVMAGAFGAGAILLLPVFVIGDTAFLGEPGGIALALYLGAIPTALAYVLFARGLRRVGAGETATLTLAEPLTAALLGVMVLGERPGALAAVGALLVLAGLALLALRPDRTAAGLGAPAAEPVAPAAVAPIPPLPGRTP